MRYGKSWTDALQEVQEQTGVRKVDFVDGITPDIVEEKCPDCGKESCECKEETQVDEGPAQYLAKKGTFEVKYASSKKGPIKVSKFPSLEQAKKFLAQVRGEGMNGIISKGGKPVKEESEIEEHCGECGAMDHVDEKMDGRKKFSGKQAKKDNEDRRAAQRKKLGILGPNEETINEADYELYHKDFSSAMQHAYAHAKKKGFTVDPEEIDNKVATGPRKPSKGKTNRYILGTDKKKKVHIQVANLDNKKFELNMYIEETEMDEASKEVKDRVKMFKKIRDKKSSQGWQKTGLKNEKKLDPVGQADADIDNDGDVDSSDKYLKKRRKAITKAVKKEDLTLLSKVKTLMKEKKKKGY